MKNKMRYFWLIAAFAVTAVFFTACDTGGGTSDPTNRRFTGTLTITYDPDREVGATLTAVHADYTGTQPDRTFQWLRGGTVIPGATEPTFVTTLHGNHSVRMSAEGFTPKTSDPINIIDSSLPNIGGSAVITPSGTVFVDTPLTATLDGGNPETADLIFEWFVDSDSQGPASAVNTFTPDAPGVVSVIITADTHSGYRTVSVTVTYIAIEGTVNITPSGPVFTGEQLTAGFTCACNAGGTNLRFDWRINGTTIGTPSNSATFTPTASGEVTVMVTATGRSSYIPSGNAVQVGLAPFEISGIRWEISNVYYDTPNLVFATDPNNTKFFQWGVNTSHPATGSVSSWPPLGGAAITAGLWPSPQPVPPVPSPPSFPNRAIPNSQPGGAFGLLVASGSTWRPANCPIGGNTTPGRFFGPNHATASLPNNMHNAIFLPASGKRTGDNGDVTNLNEGWFWTNTGEAGANYATAFFFDDNDANTGFRQNISKRYGLSIRLIAY